MDYNATAPVRPEAYEAFLPYCRELFGNPSSVHWAGRAVKGAIEVAREQVAALVNCDPGEVVFTASGSEADNMALKGVATALRSRGNQIIASRVEHPAVVNTCLFLEREGYQITWLDVDRDGLPDLRQLEAAITGRTVLIAAMHANNETGVLLPVGEMAEIAARQRVYFLCDAVQAAGRVPIDFRSQQITLLALSGHKLGAPKGVGALVVRKGAKLLPLIHGGPQERNRRAGTENVAGIVAFGKACELAAQELASESRRLADLRDRLEQGILARIADARVNGHRTLRLPTTTNIAFAGVEADSLLVALDLEGVAASSGSACSSGSLKISPVLSAMGVSPELAKGSLRFSLGWGSTEADVEYVLAILPGIVERLRKG